MKNGFLIVAVLWSALAAAKPEKIYRFVMWRDDDTGTSFMSQAQRIGPAIIKDQCHYRLRFCGQAVELEKANKICSMVSSGTASAEGETQVVEKHGKTQRLKFEIPGVDEQAPQMRYRVELNFSSQGLMTNMSKIEAIEKPPGVDTQVVEFGKKAAFFELSVECAAKASNKKNK